jgi:hypothetical protein
MNELLDIQEEPGAIKVAEIKEELLCIYNLVTLEDGSIPQTKKAEKNRLKTKNEPSKRSQSFD